MYIVILFFFMYVCNSFWNVVYFFFLSATKCDFFRYKFFVIVLAFMKLMR